MANDDVLSMSLDEIIKKRVYGGIRDYGSGSRRGFGGRGRGRSDNFRSRNNRTDFRRYSNKDMGSRLSNPRFSPYSRGNVESQWTHDLYEGNGSSYSKSGGSGDKSYEESDITTVAISNLEFGVNNHDLKELFSEFGSLESAEVDYDKSGRSLGTGELIYSNRSSALSAIDVYNGVPLDGRPMRLELFDERAKASPPPREPRSNRRVIPPYRPQGSYKRGGRGRGGFSRGGRNSQDEKVTMEQLNEELDTYLKSG